MKHALRAGAGALVLVLIGCSGAVSVSSGDKTIKVWPTADPLTGPLMVGWWMCYRDRDYAAMRESNRHGGDQRCWHQIGTADEVLEVKADGSGSSVNIETNENRAPADSFRIPGSDLLYSREGEFRWQYDQETTELLIQTTSNYRYNVETLRDSENVVRHRRGSGGLLFFRIGSPEYRQLATFLNCVQENNGRNLLDVVDCGEPY